PGHEAGIPLSPDKAAVQIAGIHQSPDANKGADFRTEARQSAESFGQTGHGGSFYDLDPELDSFRWSAHRCGVRRKLVVPTNIQRVRLIRSARGGRKICLAGLPTRGVNE